MDSDLTTFTATNLAEAIAAGTCSAREAVEAFLYRIDALDRNGPALNAMLQVNPAALEIARRRDESLARGGERGPLHGVPVVLKANVDTGDDMATSAGSLALANHRPVRDAPLVARLRAAGAVLLGKTNLSEWANFRSTRSISGWSSLGGQTRNPYGLDRSPSGSSSGSGVAVAARLAPLSVGTETDGSIVSPAGACGVVGIKPTVGTIDREGIIPIAEPTICGRSSPPRTGRPGRSASPSGATSAVRRLRRCLGIPASPCPGPWSMPCQWPCRSSGCRTRRRTSSPWRGRSRKRGVHSRRLASIHLVGSEVERCGTRVPRARTPGRPPVGCRTTGFRNVSGQAVSMW